MISSFVRKYFRFNYHLLWSKQDQPAFEAFHNHFTPDECLPFIKNEHNEHPYFFKPDKITQETLDFISFDTLLNTENNFLDDNRAYRYEQNIQEQQNLFTNNDNNNAEDDNNNEENMLENENENRKEEIAQHIKENNESEYTTPESTTSAQNATQTGRSTHIRPVTIPTRIVSPRTNTHDPQTYLNISPNRYITLNFPPHPDETEQDETQNTTSIRNISVKVSSPTRTISKNTRNTARSMYDPPSIPSAFQKSNENNRSNNQQTYSQHYDPFNYSFFHNLIQIFKQTIIQIFLNPTITLI